MTDAASSPSSSTRGVMFQYFEWNNRPDGSLWRELAAKAVELKNLGTTAVWMPPAYKGMQGAAETGYAAYDLYDLGEFDQKCSVRTKYGTRDEFLAAVRAVQDAGMHAYADVVLNHKMGGDEIEEVEVEEISPDNRNAVIGSSRKIKTWSRFTFPGRGEKYSSFKWNWQHFNAFASNADAPDESGKIYRVLRKTFSGEVAFEYGNFDYLMGCDIDLYHADVRADLFHWGKWFIETTGIDGFRLDAIKHIPASFYKDWFTYLRQEYPDRDIFSVGEYWNGDVAELQTYLERTEGVMRLFDVPLHFNFRDAANAGRDYDLRRIFDGSLLQANPLMAVTFVDNHDSQPGQSLESWVADWFKPLAYALILLRKDGYPCVFYGDYFGNSDEAHPLVSHRKLIDGFLHARAHYTYGDQHDYFDHPTCVGWVWTGDDEHPGALAVLMSTGDEGIKRMQTFHPCKTFRDLTGHWSEPVTTDDNGEADFKCPAGKVSVWSMR
ncbi:MAG TPA: alpha-amylase [Tepidisphaeraceae bacterium]